jgi:acyl-CoA thioesterase II
MAVIPDVPVLYHVNRIREGRSYATRLVRAVQNGKDVHTMMCSFQLPEPWQPTRSWQMPQVAPPESCPDEVAIIRRMATEQHERTEEAKAWLRGYAQVRCYPPLSRKLSDSLLCVYPQAREESPVAVKHAGERLGPDGRKTYLYWMKAKTQQKYPASLQKVYISL